MKRAELYLQQDTTSNWDVLTFFVATLAISRPSDIDIGRQDGGAAFVVVEDCSGFIPVRGDVHN